MWSSPTSTRRRCPPPTSRRNSWTISVIKHEPERRRFVIEGDDERGVLEYRPAGAHRLEFYRTFVPGTLRGRGIATRLVEFALDYARHEGYEVIPSCPFVARVVRSDPKYRAVVAQSES